MFVAVEHRADRQYNVRGNHTGKSVLEIAERRSFPLAATVTTQNQTVFEAITDKYKVVNYLYIRK